MFRIRTLMATMVAACALLIDAGFNPGLDGNILKVLRTVERAHGIGHNA